MLGQWDGKPSISRCLDHFERGRIRVTPQRRTTSGSLFGAQNRFSSWGLAVAVRRHAARPMK
jgi:hypothetical protein